MTMAPARNRAVIVRAAYRTIGIHHPKHRDRTRTPHAVRAAGAALLLLLTLVAIGARPGHTTLCPTEDATTPCTWNATQQGNGHGQSFTIHYDDHGALVATYADGTTRTLTP
jgi:hypothetical protein